MPPKSKPRQSSPGISSSKTSKAAGKKPRASEPAPKTGKRKSSEDSDIEEVPKKGKGGKKRKFQEVEEDEEEEEEEIEIIENKGSDDEGSSRPQNTQEGLQDIYKELSSKFQTKKAKKTTKKETTGNKDVKKLDKLFDDLLGDFEIEKEGGDNGDKTSQQKIDDFHAHLTETLDKDTEKLSKAEKLIDVRAQRWIDVFPAYKELSSVHQNAVVEALNDATGTYEKRPKKIEQTIKEFTKLQKERIQEGEERAQQILDARRMVHNSRKLMLSVIRRQ